MSFERHCSIGSNNNQLLDPSLLEGLNEHDRREALATTSTTELNGNDSNGALSENEMKLVGKTGANVGDAAIIADEELERHKKLKAGSNDDDPLCASMAPKALAVDGQCNKDTRYGISARHTATTSNSSAAGINKKRKMSSNVLIPGVVSTAKTVKTKALNKITPRDCRIFSRTPSSPIVIEESDEEKEGLAGSKFISNLKVKVLFDKNENLAERDIQQSEKGQNVLLLPKKETRVFQCWTCLSPLRQNTPKEYDFQYDEYPLYDMHLHPILECPICLYCSEFVEAAELDRIDTNCDEATASYCAGCGQEEHEGMILFLCDETEECKRSFCHICVTKAYGGGETGKVKVADLQADEEEPWRCPACDPPEYLRALRREVQANAEHAPMEGKRRNIDVLMKDFDVAETELQECQKKLISMNESGDLAIREELSKIYSDDMLETEIETEVNLLSQELRRHEVNVGSFIASLQEEAQFDHNVSPFSIYDEGLGLSKQRAMNCDDDDNNVDDDEPDYVKPASKENAMRERKRTPVSLPKDDNDYYVDVEDLDNNIEESAETEYCKNGWGGMERPSRERIERLTDLEDKKMLRLKCPRPRKIDETQDEQECRQDELEALGQCSVEGKQVLLARNEFKLLQKARISSVNQSSSQSLSTPTKALHSLEARRSIMLMSGLSPLHPSLYNDRPVEHRVMFKGSTFTICDRNVAENVRTVVVATKLVNSLMPHQMAGITFMWENCFSDFACTARGNESLVGGCVLAHHMGLGKSLSTIALLHAVMRHPSLVDNENNRRLIRTVLLVAPKNTIVNWEKEFYKWLEDIDPLMVYDLGSVHMNARQNTIDRWQHTGGILLVTAGVLAKCIADPRLCKSLQPNVLVVDEAHSMLNTSTTKIFSALSEIKTPRKIALTGSPMQNNLREYFCLVKFVRPCVLNLSDTEFDRQYAEPIARGMALDTSPRGRFDSLLKSRELREKFSPYVHRVNGSELRKDLPPLIDVVLHVRRSTLQKELYRAYNHLKATDERYSDFFTQKHNLMLVNNHPACLFQRKNDAEKSTSSFRGSDAEKTISDVEWWRPAFEAQGLAKAASIDNGYKIKLLLHILSLAQAKNEKVVIFSHSKETLNFIEYVLEIENWKKHLPSLEHHFPGMNLGGWRKSLEYLRIDGDTSTADRGDLVSRFNSVQDMASGKQLRAFLLCKAGAVGINLQAATRVVLIDSEFNPTCASQAVCRAHRFGQTKQVFCYRFVIQDTMEEKVFSRAVNKIGLCLQIIDHKTINQNFASHELEKLSEIRLPVFVRCVDCKKRRILLDASPCDTTPDIWRCHMNVSDPINNNCNASEKDEEWYDNYRLGKLSTNTSAENPLAQFEANQEENLPKKLEDDFLNHLLKLKGKWGPIIGKHVFHDDLLQTKNHDEELELARNDLERCEKIQNLSGNDGLPGNYPINSIVSKVARPSVPPPRVQEKMKIASHFGPVHQPTTCMETKNGASACPPLIGQASVQVETRNVEINPFPNPLKKRLRSFKICYSPEKRSSAFQCEHAKKPPSDNPPVCRKKAFPHGDSKYTKLPPLIVDTKKNGTSSEEAIDLSDSD